MNGTPIGAQQRKNTTQAHAGGTVITLATATRGVLTSGLPRVTYIDTAHELVGVGGGAVAPFVDFPVTVTP